MAKNNTKTACVTLDANSLNILDNLTSKRSQSLFINSAIRYYYEHSQEGRVVFFDEELKIQPLSHQEAKDKGAQPEPNAIQKKEKEVNTNEQSDISEKGNAGIKLDDW
jgi:hypothetical protein